MRKYTATQVFDGYKFLPTGTVIITDEQKKIIDIVPLEQAGDDMQNCNGILSPGFVNCHCHLELSHLKGLVPEHTGMVDFLIAMMRQPVYAEEVMQQHIADAEEEMIRNGIVAVGDIANTTRTIAQKEKQNVHYHTFVEIAASLPSAAQARFDALKNVYDAFTGRKSLVPHAPYSVSPQLFALIRSMPNNEIMSMHNQECVDENEYFRSKTGEFVRFYKDINMDISFFEPTGKSSLQSVWPMLPKVKKTLLVHNVDINADDILFVNNVSPIDHRPSTIDGIHFVLCPSANLYINNTLPNVDLLMQHNANICLGTDSLASNHQLSILSEIQVLQKNFPQLTMETLLRWATSNGAAALDLQDVLGNFEVGKTPGLVVVENNGKGVRRL
jgi:aminodeoxyfutalosine deaminase